MEDHFERKVTISEAMEVENGSDSSSNSNVLNLLRRFLGIQQQRAEAYARLRSNTILLRSIDTEVWRIMPFSARGFADYMGSGGDLAYQQLCSEITVEFNNCSKQVLEIESLLLNPDYARDDLAHLLRAVQEQEKKKLHLTATIQVLKKAGRPSERLINHENCRFKKPLEHECVHVRELTEADGTEEAEADAEYNNALKEAIKGVQDAVTCINEHLEEVRYEVAAHDEAE